LKKRGNLKKGSERTWDFGDSHQKGEIPESQGGTRGGREKRGWGGLTKKSEGGGEYVVMETQGGQKVVGEGKEKKG